MLEQNMASMRETKRDKVGVGPGLRECEAGYETNSCVELRVRWRGLYALERGEEHERAKVGTANRTWPLQDGEREKSEG